MTLKAELEMNDDFERQTKDVALNTKLNMRLWTPNWICGFEHQNWKVMVALNVETEKRWWFWTAKLKSDGSFECRNRETMVGLNAETEKRWWFWTPKLRNDGGSERQNWEAMMALNTWTGNKRWLWTPNWRCGFECQTEYAALNAGTEKWWWFWTPKLRSDDGFERLN